MSTLLVRLLFVVTTLLAPRVAAAEGEPEPAAAAEPAAGSAAEPASAEPATGEPAEPGAVGAPAPAITADQLRAMVAAARTKVLDRLEAKMEAKSAARMGTIATAIGWFSLAGLLLLLAPLVLRKRCPGRGGTLLKYSALAAVTFFVTVNLFGMVVVGFRSAQAALGPATNPQLHIASGFFDAIDNNAEEYLQIGGALFAPTIEQLQGDTDEQPAALLIENGKRIVKDADVFITVGRAFGKLDFVFALLPTVLLLVTLVLFVLAIRPTLMEIIRLPIAAASGDAAVGRTVVKRALRQIGGEIVATICTIGVLVVLTLAAGAVLGRVVGPALDALIGYFSLGVLYLQVVERASSGLVFVMLFSVIIFLALNLAAVIVAMSLFLGKSQKIFQRKFNAATPLAAHRRFWTWGPPAVALALVLPWIYIVIADWGLDKINDKLAAGASGPADIPWTAIMLLGPLLLVVGFVVVFWAARGIKALKFLATYKVVTPPPP